MQTLTDTIRYHHALYGGTHGDWLVFGAFGPDEYTGWAAAEAAQQIIVGAVIEVFTTPGAPIWYVLVDPTNADAIERAEDLLAEPTDIYESDAYYEAECAALQVCLDALIEPDERLDVQSATGIDLYAYGYSALTGKPLDGRMAIV